MGAWEKLQLGWLDFDVVGRGSNVRGLRLGLAEKTGPDAQAVVVPAPGHDGDQDVHQAGHRDLRVLVRQG